MTVYPKNIIDYENALLINKFRSKYSYIDFKINNEMEEHCY